VAALGAGDVEGVAFAEEQAGGGEVGEGLVGEGVGAVEVAGLVEELRAEREGVGRCDGVVDVAGLERDEAVEKLDGARYTVGPLFARGGGKEVAVVVECFGEGDGLEDGDALPGAEGEVVDPGAVGAGDGALGPVVDVDGGVKVLRIAGGVGYAEERVDCVAAAAVDEAAGGAEDGAVDVGVGEGELVGEEAVAPGLEGAGVESVLRSVGRWPKGFGVGEVGESEGGGGSEA